MRSLFSLVFFFATWNCFGQASMITSGNWATATNWSGSNIGNLVTETVTISNNVNPTINSGSNFVVGATTLNNNNTLNINSGGTLNVGNSSNAFNLTTNNNANITVAGTLVIWGSLIVNNNIVWNITGTVIIKGSVQLNNNANLNVTGGTLQIGGNFTASNNTNISVPSGSISVAGNVNVGGGSNLNGCTGCFHVGGSCSGPASFCSNSVLPITLSSFEGHCVQGTAVLEWSTASEINFDNFRIERSADARAFDAIGTVAGHGTTTSLNHYSFVDFAPPAGVTYYRLTLVDRDGSIDYSKVIAVKVQHDQPILISPNPVDSKCIQLLVNYDPSPDDRLIIYNNTGIAVMKAELTARGVVQLQHHLSPGLYLLCYSAKDHSGSIRFYVN